MTGSRLGRRAARLTSIIDFVLLQPRFCRRRLQAARRPAFLPLLEEPRVLDPSFPEKDVCRLFENHNPRRSAMALLFDAANGRERAPRRAVRGRSESCPGAGRPLDRARPFARPDCERHATGAAADSAGTAYGAEFPACYLDRFPSSWPWPLAALLPAGSAAAQGAVRSKHGDWELRCETPAGASREQCALIQSVAAEDRPNVNLVVIVLKTADGKSRLLRVLAPLGVLLPSGLGLKVDQTDRRAGRLRALPADRLCRRSRDGRQADRTRCATAKPRLSSSTRPQKRVSAFHWR